MAYSINWQNIQTCFNLLLYLIPYVAHIRLTITTTTTTTMGNNNNKQIWETLRTSSSGWPLDECNRNGNRNRNRKKQQRWKKYIINLCKETATIPTNYFLWFLYIEQQNSSSAAHRLKLGDIGGLPQTDTWLINELCNYRQKQTTEATKQRKIANNNCLVYAQKWYESECFWATVCTASVGHHFTSSTTKKEAFHLHRWAGKTVANSLKFTTLQTC